MPSWIGYAIASLAVASLKGCCLKRTAESIGRPREVNLVSMLVTLALGAVLLWGQRPTNPEPLPFVLLALLAGVTYTLFAILSSSAQAHLSFSIYSAAMKLALVMPLVFFYLILKERPSALQWTGIVGSTLPLVAMSLSRHQAPKEESAAQGLLPLVGAVLSGSALQILNKVAMSEDIGFGIDSTMFLVGINVVAAVATMGVIAAHRDGLQLTRPTSNAGVAVGVLNFVSFYCFLKALKNGPASIIVPLNSLNVVFSAIMLEILSSRRLVRGSLIMGACALICIVLMLMGEAS